MTAKDCTKQIIPSPLTINKIIMSVQSLVLNV